jgi:hypothetical protein
LSNKSGIILAMKTVAEQLSSVGDDGYIYSNQAQALGKKGNQRGASGCPVDSLASLLLYICITFTFLSNLD